MGATDKDSDGEATQGGITATGTTDADNHTTEPKEPFPFMRLPPELRLMVYQFALREITDPIMFPSSGEAQKSQPYRGALAFLHTSKLLRMESWFAMWNNVRRCRETSFDDYRGAFSRYSEVCFSTRFGSPAYEQAREDWHRASHRNEYMTSISQALSKAMKAHYGIPDRKLEKSKAALGSSSHDKANE